MSELITLYSKRLMLRPLKPSDLQHLMDLDQDPEVMKFMGNKLNSTEYLQNLLNNLIKRQSENVEYGVWMADDINTGETVGWFNLDPFPFLNNEFDAGARIKRQFWQKGYATEGYKLVVNYGLSELKLPKVIGVTHLENLPSHKLLYRTGFVRVADFPSPFLKKYFGEMLAKFEIYK